MVDILRSGRRTIAAPALCLLGAFTAATIGCGKDSPTAPLPRTPPVIGQVVSLNFPAIQGHVREVDGPALAGVTVVAFLTGPGPIVQLVTDSEGNFSFPMRGGSGPERLYAYLGDWGDQFIWNGGPIISPAADPPAVSVLIKFQRALTIRPNEVIDTQLTDDAPSFDFYSEGNESLACQRCVGVIVKPNERTDLNLRVRASEPGPLRLSLVGSNDYYDGDVLIATAKNAPDTADVTMPIAQAALDKARYHMVLYVERPAGPTTVSLHITLAPGG